MIFSNMSYDNVTNQRTEKGLTLLGVSEHGNFEPQ
jgi:hypothetical protein